MTERVDIGAVRSLKIDVLTETGWFDDAHFKRNMADYGGAEQTQYRIAWDAENAGGYAALLTLTLADGDERRILLDTGWNTAWMDYVFARHGVDRMLERGEIDCMVLSHWHLDHFWGIESTLKHNPRLKLYAPATWCSEDQALLRDKATVEVEDRQGRRVPICGNAVAHEGELVLTEPGGEDGSGLYRLLPGVALHVFDASMLLQVRGENVIYVNVADKGIVTVTGCGHPGIMSLLGFAKERLAAPGLYGCYGGLHLSIFDTWKPEFDTIIDDINALGMTKMGCNHCTGWMWAEKAATHGVPIIKGTDAYLSYPKRSAQAKGSHAFLGNGDSVTF
ncbi:Metal-dependent hydrolase, beta-lactamase superfamily II [Candidatus Defluviicoccus seviourii]|uniref:Metal-dependent hydrolase, beta-lactamase superfamily II n=1 Tax=Candidatus Defluviicoccus seviourii TaxID=2565273 RepID=A0A564WFJ1_9PROT|nr:Metal-dependent hydrolase, beta-lactamase superfamily II [Candidatus Defluviicoccus seviourii]